MYQVICPVDGKPCDPDCPDRYTDRPEGGCLMTTMQEHSDSLLLFHPLDRPGYKTPQADRAEDGGVG